MLGRLVMILPDNDPNNAEKSRGYYISQILTKLTSVVDLFSSVTFSLSNKLDGSTYTDTSLPDLDNIFIVLLMCHKNLNCLKGFIRGNFVVLHIYLFFF